MKRYAPVFALAAVLAVFLTGLWLERSGKWESSGDGVLKGCVADAYYKNYKAFADNILKGGYDWNAAPIMSYEDVRRIHAGIAKETQAHIAADPACGPHRARAAFVAHLIEEHRAGREEYQKDKDSLCMAVYLRRNGYNPCDH
jgi:hypothetical protein